MSKQVVTMEMDPNNRLTEDETLGAGFSYDIFLSWRR